MRTHNYDESGWIFVMTGLTEPLVIGGSAGKGEGYKRVIMPPPQNFNQPPHGVCVGVCVFSTLITQVVDTTVEDTDERVQCWQQQQTELEFKKL